MSAPEIDARRAPLIKIRLPEVCSIEEIAAHFEELDRCLRPGARVMLLYDFRAMKVAALTAAHRRAVADGLTAFRSRHPPDAVIGTSVVARGAMMLGMLKAVSWLSPPKRPFKAFEELPAAEDWALQMIERRPR